MSSGVVITPIGRLSFPFLFEKDDKDKYRAVLIFRGDQTKELEAIQALVDETCEKKWGKGKVPKKIKLPIHLNTEVEDNDGNRRAGYEDDDGQHIRCWSTKRPKVVGREKDPENPGKLLELTRDEVYAGCYVRASVSAYAGTHDEGGPYCSLILSNIQKVAEGEPLAGVITEPENDFADDVNDVVS